MRWEGRRQSDNIEDRRGMRVSRGGLVGGGLGTLAIALLVMFLGGDPTPVLQQAGQPQVEATDEPYAETAEEAKRREFVATMLATTEDLWNRQFADMGGSYQAPRLVLFREAVESGCGVADSGVGPFYCPPDHGVFLDMTFFDEMATKLQAGGDFAYAYVVAHEVGHHVQNLLGISDRVQGMRQRVSEVEGNQLSVRLELQADCYAGIFGNYARAQGMIEPGDFDEGLRAASAIGDDRLQRSSGRMVIPDSFTHGTSEQRQRWLHRGIETGSTDACDTFKAADL
jgi:predicted metalloprotease